MGDIYIRQSSFADGDTITASLFNSEFDQLVLAFNAVTGHSHDGTAGEGGPITMLGPTQDLTVTASSLLPSVTNAISVGTPTFQFRDGYFDGTVNVDSLVIGSSAGITSVDTDLSSVSASDDTVASAKAIKSYVDSQVTAQDLDVTTDSGTIAIDLDSEVLTIAGGTGLSSLAAGNSVTLNIDSTVTTNSGVQTLTNKVINASNNTLSNITVSMLAGAAVVTNAEGIPSNNNDTTLPTSAAVKSYVDSAVASEDTLSEMNDTNIVSPISGQVIVYDGVNSWDNKSLSGDVTMNASGSVTIGNNKVSYAKMQDVSATDKLLGRSSAGSGDIEEITCTAAGRALLADSTSTAQLQTLGLTATATEINTLDGYTGSVTDFNKLAAVTASSSELNLLDGVTATTAEINYTDGVTSNIQTQIDAANSNALALSIALG